MKKTLLLVACVIGSSIFASGQAQTPQNAAIPSTTPFQPFLRITAHRVVQTVGSEKQKLLGVQMVIDNVTITADEVDARMTPNGAGEYDLRGNVHVTMNPR